MSNMNNNKRVIIAVLCVIWAASPDLIPGFIDDIFAVIIACKQIQEMISGENE